MPGSFVFRPIEAHLTHNTDLIGKMNPYCNFIFGDEKIKTQVCKKGGKNPHWDDSVTISSDKIAEPKLIVELMDKDHITKDDVIGITTINLNEIQTQGESSKWYPVFYKHHPAGEILIESTFKGDFGAIIPGAQNEKIIETDYFSKPVEVIETEKVIVEEVPRKVFTEQHQIVEPHTFMKNVEVVETVSVLKEIEVMEPRKVLKDVEYTEAVPVMKTIEVVEPQVVMKEIEVIEPRVVTKTIEVVENVPVMKQIEVVEMKHMTKEVETFEPQTFHKQVEVIEHVPVMKTVTVSEPVTVTKAVEFVEPIITTQTITKEIIQPVVVDEKITTTVGPATVIGTEIDTKIISESAFIEKKIAEEKFIEKKL